MDIKIEQIPSSETHILRQRVLRPHHDVSEMVFPFDDMKGVFHLGAFLQGEIVGIVSLYPESEDGEFHQGQWRLRGMAVDLKQQGLGIGKLLVEESLKRVQATGASLLWCNGRTSAMGFYLGLGFQQIGEEFLIHGIGPHLRARYHF